MSPYRTPGERDTPTSEKTRWRMPKTWSRLPRRREDAVSDRIHLAYCDQCGDEIYEGDRGRVDRERVKVFGRLDGSWSTEPRHVLGPTRYTCERCIAGEVSGS